MRRCLSLFVALAAVFATSTAAAENVVDHEPFGELLETYVDADGQVAYGKWAESDDDRERLEAYLADLAEADLEGHSEPAKLAFYLNAYNAYVLEAVLEAWPTESPKSIEGFFDGRTHEVAGREMTLDELEHGLVREKFDEPRIHFVLVCAAKACPRLRTTPLTEANLDRQLEAAAEEFVPRVTELEDGKVVTSQLFNWFSEDFEQAEGSVRAYLSGYVDGKLEEALGDEEVEVTFREYDWTVNSSD